MFINYCTNPKPKNRFTKNSLAGLVIGLALFAICFLSIPDVHAEGSVEMNNSGGDRPYLEYRDDLNAGIMRRTYIYVYAQTGETIQLASSANGVGGGVISYTRPNGTTGTCATNVGVIANRAQELAGPNPGGGYNACNIVVAAGQTGVWQIRFVSPNISNYTNPPAIASTGNWVQANNVGYVAAWDVTVRSATNVKIPGRVYANYLALNMGANGRALSSLVYIQTSDGYRYHVDLNNMDPFGFIFFSSPKGLTDSTTNIPLYHSVDLEGPNPGSLPAGVAINVSDSATHKIFFNIPDYAGLPPSATIAGGSTWLDVPTFIPPVPTNFQFTGAEGTPGQGGTNPLGGYFSFTTTIEASFSIWLDINHDGIYGNSNDRQIFGYGTVGSNSIYWNGLDGNGVAAPPGIQAYNAQITLNAGEIHFPFIDVESNPSGFVIVRDVPNTNPPDPSLLYWDDRLVTQETGNVPPAPLVTLSGLPSSGGAHSFSGNYGDREAIENWTYMPTIPVVMTGGVLLEEADLEVIKTHFPANPVAGQPFGYTITVINHGPNDSIGATFTDTLPASMTGPSWTCTVTTGTGSCSAASGTSAAINLSLNISNGATITITVNGTLAVGAVPPITNTATITRSLDVSDPNLANNTATDTFILTPSFTLTKTASVANVTTAGQVINYTMTLRNTGTQSLTNVSISDPFVGALACVPAQPATLAPAATLVCTGTHTVTQSEMDAGASIVNTATGTTAEVASQNASATVTVTRSPALSIVKSVTEVNYSVVGAVLHYSFLVTNSGNVNLAGPFTVTDDRSTDETCPATAALAPGASITCTATYTVTQADLDAGSVTNIASAHGFFAGNPVNSATDSKTVPAFIRADLWLEKTASTLTPIFRDNVTFTLTVHNDGPSNATGVTVQDVLPAGLAYVSDNGGGAYAGGIWTVGNLAVGASASLQITANIIDPLPISNYAQVWTSDQPDSDSTPGDNSLAQDDNALVTITPQYSRIIVEKIMLGGVDTFTFTGTLNGTIAVDGGILDIILPPGTYTSTESPLTGWNLTSITCNDANSTGDLPTRTATFRAEPFETIMCSFTNTYAGQPDLSILKSDGGLTAVPGGVIPYTLTYANAGVQAATGVVITETVPANTTFTPAASTAGWICAPDVNAGSTCTIAIGDVAAGANGSVIFAVTAANPVPVGVTSIANTVVIADDGTHGTDPNPGDNTSTDTTPITVNPAWTLTKTADVASVSTAGTVIHYTLTLTNTGNEILTGITIADPMLGTLACTPAQPAALAPLAAMTCTGSYTVTLADLNAGTDLVNTATGDTDQTGTQTASSTVTVTQNPALSIVKSVTETNYAAVGDVLHYSYLVTNTGNVTLTGPFTVTDDRSTDETCPATATLAPGASITCTATYTITQADLDAGSVTNIASAHGTFGGNPVTSPTDTETVGATLTPAIQLLKTGTLDLSVVPPAGVANPGDTIIYTFTVTNTGNVTLFNITLTDPLITVNGGPIPSLAPGVSDSTTFTGSHVLTQGDIDAGTFTNTALASGNPPTGQPVTDPDDDTQTLAGAPAISAVKSSALVVDANGDGLVQPGDVLEYTIVVTNSGNVTAAGVSLADTPDANTSLVVGSVTATQGTILTGNTAGDTSVAVSIGSIAPTGAVTVTFRVTVNNPLPAGVESVINMGVVSGSNFADTDTNPATNPVVAWPDLTIVKSTGTTQAVPNGVIQYTLDYANVGNQDATGVEITEVVPANTSFEAASSTAGWTCTPNGNAGNTCTFTIGSLAAGGSGQVTFALRVAAAIPAGVETIANTAVIADDGANGADPTPENNSDAVTTPLAANPDLAVVKTDNNAVAAPGQVVVYSLIVTNNGNQGATGIVLSETVPTYTTFEPGAGTSGWTCTPDGSAGNPCTFDIASLAAGASQTVQFAVRLDALLPAGVAQLSNTVTVADDGSNGADPTPGDNSGSDTTPVDAAPNLAVTKTDGVNQVTPGSVLTYTLTISNVGGQEATGVTITDTLPAGLLFQSASDGGTYNTATRQITWTLASLPAGQSVTRTVTVQVDPALGGDVMLLTNVAVVQDDGNNGVDPDPGNNNGSDTDMIGSGGKLIVAHSLSATILPQVAIGEMLTYEVSLTVSPGEVTNLTLLDVLDRGLAFVDCNIIAPAGLTASPLDFGQVCSQAVIIGKEPADSTNPADAGRRMEMTLGTVTNSTAEPLDLVIRYQVVVLDNAENVDGVQLNNDALWQWDGGSVAATAAPVTVVEPELMIDKAVDTASALPGTQVTFTLAVYHTADSHSPAYDVQLVDVLGEFSYVPGSLVFVSGQMPTLMDVSNPARLVVGWDVFANTGQPTVLRFKALVGQIGPGQTATNTAQVFWTSLPGDVSAPQTGNNPVSTERRYQPGSAVDVYAAEDTADVDYPSNITLPKTGFAPGVLTALGPMSVNYASLGNVWLEIPTLGVQLPIVGVPMTENGWQVEWLDGQAGWLQGTAFPGYNGNSVLTAHVYDADGSAGPFVSLHSLKYGDQILVHAFGTVYTYEVRTIQQLKPANLSPLAHKDKPWLTLITCQGFDEKSSSYLRRDVVQAVLISIK